MAKPTDATSSECSPDNPQRIKARRAQYAAILREHQEDASEQLVSAFLDKMEGKEYGEGPLLSAFAWFWNGWVASSGARYTASETAPSFNHWWASCSDAFKSANKEESLKMAWYSGRAALSSIPSEIAPSGCKLVPTIPTVDQIVAAIDVMGLCRLSSDQYQRIYTAMLNAAPQVNPDSSSETDRGVSTTADREPAAAAPVSALSATPTNRVVCAAIRNVHGSIICSARHFDGLMHAQIALSTQDGWKQAEQGFIDQRGTFLTREQALTVALGAGQIIRRCGNDKSTLYSENLY